MLVAGSFMPLIPGMQLFRSATCPTDGPTETSKANKIFRVLRIILPWLRLKTEVRLRLSARISTAPET